MTFSAELIKQKALELGFNLVGVTRAEPSPTLAAYEQWIAQDYHAGMGYMARSDRVERRQNPQVILPDAVSFVMVGLDYRTHPELEHLLTERSRGRIASYAWGVDYHPILEERLQTLAEWLDRQINGQTHRAYVDTGAILERSHAQQAGLGFIGKNTLLIHPHRGSYFFLGELITTLEFDTYDTPHKETMCGTCTRCLQACPTDAFPAPYVLDAGRCISYHTIENKGAIDLNLRADFGNWVYGCDVCQDVCPWQRFDTATGLHDFLPLSVDHIAPKLTDLLALDSATFNARYAQSPIKRIKRDRLVRNACIAAGNSGDAAHIPYLITLLYDPAPLVRSHAAWGLWRLMRDDAHHLITSMYHREDDDGVRAEIEAFMG